MKRFFKIVFLVIFVVIILWTIFHQIMNKIEPQALKENQTFVTVNDSKIHYVKSGEGSETIILLTGLGTPSPSTDFQPLMDLLDDNYTVYSIEPFGYGLSDVVDTERNISNITDELHQAINALGIREPYYLMAHSISGIYSIKYADSYPEEVKGLIGIDSSIPGQKDLAINSALGYNLMNFFGAFRLLSSVAPDAIIPEALNYSDEELDITLKIISYNMFNKSLLSEMLLVQESVEIAGEVTLDPTLPVLILLAEDTVNEVTVSEDDQWVKLHDDFLSNQENYHYVIIEGSHYLHRMSADAIVKETNEFINNLNNSLE